LGIYEPAAIIIRDSNNMNQNNFVVFVSSSSFYR